MKAIVDLTKELIRFKSVQSRPEEIGRCADFIETVLESGNVDYRRVDHCGIPSILVVPNSRHAPILLMSHMDVVDAPDTLFDPVEKKGNLYGRGSIDDKYAVALSLVLLQNQLDALRGQGKDQQDLPFGVLITGDEEIGGANGAQKMLTEFTTDFCIALDGGSVDKIVTREKGILRLKLVAQGRSAHGARPWLGENAIENLWADYLKIKSFFTETDPDHWHRTLNFSRIHAGQSDNQVPDRAEALFDIRYTEKDDPDHLAAAMAGEISGELQVLSKDPVFDSGRSTYLDLLLELAKGTKVGFEHGASDARHLSAQGIAAIVWGADGDLSQHSGSEHVNISSLTRLYDILNRFMIKAAAIAPFNRAS